MTSLETTIGAALLRGWKYCCIRVKGEKTEQYFISQSSVERYAQELKQLENISHTKFLGLVPNHGGASTQVRAALDALRSRLH